MKLYTVCVDDKCGYVDGTGNFVIPPRFEAANPFVNGRAWVQEDGLIGVIDATGAWVIPPWFRYMGDSAANGLVLMSERTKTMATLTPMGRATTLTRDSPCIMSRWENWGILTSTRAKLEHANRS